MGVQFYSNWQINPVLKIAFCDLKNDQKKILSMQTPAINNLHIEKQYIRWCQFKYLLRNWIKMSSKDLN